MRCCSKPKTKIFFSKFFFKRFNYKKKVQKECCLCSWIRATNEEMCASIDINTCGPILNEMTCVKEIPKI